jgi:hypothetical protein
MWLLTPSGRLAEHPAGEEGWPRTNRRVGAVGVIVPGLRVQQDGETVTINTKPPGERSQQFSRKGNLIHQLGGPKARLASIRPGPIDIGQLYEML